MSNPNCVIRIRGSPNQRWFADEAFPGDHTRSELFFHTRGSAKLCLLNVTDHGPGLTRHPSMVRSIETMALPVGWVEPCKVTCCFICAGLRFTELISSDQ